MGFLHINKNTDKNMINKLNNIVKKNNTKVFILIYMENCGPCNATRPEWKKIENIYQKLKNNQHIYIVDIDKDLIGKLSFIKTPPIGFPTILYVTNNGQINEVYSEDNREDQFRKIDSFIRWIKSKIGENKKKQFTFKKKFQGGAKTRKWSLKYKKSINCRRPKGFSQKQYCKYKNTKN